MNFFKKLSTSLSAFALMVAIVASHGGVASAACWQYDPSGFPTTSTPVFNNVCGVPSFGDESDFLRIRTNQGGNAFSGSSTYVDTVNATCNDGDRFDIKSYLHNDANPSANATTGVATGVVMHNTSALGSTNSNFTFASRITANNASAVFDTAGLNCSGGDVSLELVANSVLMQREFNNSITTLPNGGANGDVAINSGDPAYPGGVPGCWNFRVQVGYTVIVRKAPQPQSSATCNLLTIAALPNRTVRISGLTFSNSNATFNGVRITWGDGTSATYNTIAEATAASHQYTRDGSYTVTAVMTFTGVNGQFTATSAACAKPVVFTSGGGTTPNPTPPAPTTLPNTGAGSTMGIFAAVTAAGALAHRYFLGRRLNRQ